MHAWDLTLGVSCHPFPIFLAWGTPIEPHRDQERGWEQLSGLAQRGASLHPSPDVTPALGDPRPGEVEAAPLNGAGAR